MKNTVENEMKLADGSVWVLADGKQIDYSDGPAIERRLVKILNETSDHSTGSDELAARINDWPTEYYLTQKRSQLLKGFDFKRSQKVLEVGCGHGAITRFLGETFDEVVSVEGNLNRAKIARLRTKELANVSVLCAPFQELRFKKKFDVVFCVGVLEYSNIFVESEKPFDAMLELFKDLLAPGGVLVLAIENQFGLKYFASAGEDHNNIMFDGLEGYPRHDRERTFGYTELKALVKRHFRELEFYFPYPDYKTPSCVLSEKLFPLVNAGELVGGIPHNKYLNYPRPLFDELFALPELARNQMLPFFSNSFLVVAGQEGPLPVKMDCLGQYFNTSRAKKFHTVTKFVETPGGVRSRKTNLLGQEQITEGPLTLRNCDDAWQDGVSLHERVILTSKRRDLTLAEMFAPCRTWTDFLRSSAVREGGEYLLDGKHFDSIWKNTYIRDAKCVFIDQEWEWKEKINLNVLVVRCVYDFLYDVSLLTDVAPVLKGASRKALVRKIAGSFGVELRNSDFRAFCDLESRACSIIFGISARKHKAYLKLALWNTKVLAFLLALKALGRRAAVKFFSKL